MAMSHIPDSGDFVSILVGEASLHYITQSPSFSVDASTGVVTMVAGLTTEGDVDYEVFISTHDHAWFQTQSFTISAQDVGQQLGPIINR